MIIMLDYGDLLDFVDLPCGGRIVYTRLFCNRFRADPENAIRGTLGRKSVSYTHLGFDKTKYDCSSLMQYMFYYGAGVNLELTTRTQVSQGTHVPRSELSRGDLIFFTNSTRYNKTGVERIGHVALYLGGNYILHTATDYAVIEEISAQRWSYYIETRRMI